MTRGLGDVTTARPAALLAVLAGVLLALAVAPPAGAQSPVPSLFVVGATLRQADEQLQFTLRFNRSVPVRELQPRRGRTVCVVVSPDRPSRRRACVSRRDRRLRATLVRIDETGAAAGVARALHD